MKQLKYMETDASEQTTTLSSSHEIGGGSAGARSGYRPDPKAARDKFYVASSDSRDQAQMTPESENPICGRLDWREWTPVSRDGDRRRRDTST